MIEVFAIFLMLAVAFGTMFALGVRFWARRHGVAVWVLYAATAGLIWWAGHYLNQLPWHAEGDLLWHRRYMMTILVLGPLSILLSGLVGYRCRMKEYLREHNALPRGSK